MADPAPVLLTVRIGAPVFDLARALPGLVHLEDKDDNSPVTLTEPAVVTIEAGTARLTLPPTRFVMVSQAAGVVFGVDTSPMLEFGSLEECHAMALSLQTDIAAAGWEIVDQYLNDLGAMRAEVAAGARVRYEKGFSIYRKGSASLRLYIKEALGMGLEGRVPPARGNLFLVNVDVVDESVGMAAKTRMFEKRAASGAGANSIPLERWRPGAS